MKKYEYNIVKWNLEKYNTSPQYYQQFQILLLMENANTHLVSIFKDYLLLDDTTEFFKEYYLLDEIYPRLKKIYNYYEYSSYLFPNYTAIYEGKYIYKNIIKKQRLIDYLEDMEDIKKEKENKIKNKQNKNSGQSGTSSSYIEVFDSNVIDSIRKETNNDSNINDLFCVGNKNKSQDENSKESDSMLSILKLTEEFKDKDKNKEKAKINSTNITKKNIDKTSLFNILFQSSDNRSNNLKKDNNEDINIKKDEIFYRNGNLALNNKTKIYVSRRIRINSNINNKVNLKLQEQNTNYNSSHQKRNLINRKLVKNIIHTNKILLSEPNKRNNFSNVNKTNPNQKNDNKNINYNKKTNLKKNNNNIIINIINNNKNNNFQSNGNYFPNFTNNTINNNSKNYSSNYTYTNEMNNDNIFLKNIKKNIFLYNSNNNSIRKINNNSNFKEEHIIRNPLSYREKKIKSLNIIENTKKMVKVGKKEIRPKILSLGIFNNLKSYDTNIIQNLKEKIKNSSQSNSIKKVKEFNRIKNVIIQKKKIRKRTLSEEIEKLNGTFSFMKKYNDISSYSKRINTYNIIPKSPHMKNNSNQISKNNNYISINNSKINFKSNQHHLSNTENFDSKKLMNKINSLNINDRNRNFKMKKYLYINKTQKTSINNSKEKNNLPSNKNIKSNRLDSFSPNRPELENNKINKRKREERGKINKYIIYLVPKDSKIKILKTKKKEIKKSN